MSFEVLCAITSSNSGNPIFQKYDRIKYLYMIKSELECGFKSRLGIKYNVRYVNKFFYPQFHVSSKQRLIRVKCQSRHDLLILTIRLVNFRNKRLHTFTANRKYILLISKYWQWHFADFQLDNICWKVVLPRNVAPLRLVFQFIQAVLDFQQNFNQSAWKNRFRIFYHQE